MSEQRIRGFTAAGGCVIRQMLPHGTSGGATNLTQEEFNAYRQARLQADSRNGGNLERAKAILEAAGFEVLWG